MRDVDILVDKYLNDVEIDTLENNAEFINYSFVEDDGNITIYYEYQAPELDGSVDDEIVVSLKTLIDLF